MYFDFNALSFKQQTINEDKLAIVGSDRELTWKQFAEEVDETVARLEKLELSEGHPVIIYGHKEAAFVVTMVACMRLGLPYVPVDVIYPLDRMKKIRDIVKSAVTISLPDNTWSVDQSKVGTSYLRDDPIIYIIFTSGSTGEPKGVQITQSSILNFSEWLGNDFGFVGGKVFMNQAPFSFDLSVYELIGFLSFGGTLVLNSRDVIEKDYLSFFERIKKYDVDTWVSTPSFIARFLMSEDFAQNKIPSLDVFLFCGEVLPATTAKRILASFPNGKVVNSYGPTEATVATTRVQITPELINAYNKSLPVGCVKPGTELRILEPDGDGVGEIQIIGDNVSIGYFANDDLNAEKFGIVEGKRAFRTGDFGFFSNDMLFFANRKDELIKMHGFRIELSEIDAVLVNLSQVSEATTVPLKRRGEVQKLISFILCEKNTDTEQIKNQLSEKLPYYMIPADVVVLEKFPYNNSHKVDRKALVDIYCA